MDKRIMLLSFLCSVLLLTGFTQVQNSQTSPQAVQPTSTATAPSTPPPSPYVTLSAVEKAQIEMYAAENKAKVKKAKKLMAEANKLQKRLEQIRKELQQLSNSIVEIQKVR